MNLLTYIYIYINPFGGLKGSELARFARFAQVRERQLGGGLAAAGGAARGGGLRRLRESLRGEAHAPPAEVLVGAGGKGVAGGD